MAGCGNIGMNDLWVVEVELTFVDDPLSSLLLIAVKLRTNCSSLSVARSL